MTDPLPHHHKRSILTALRGSFLTGLVVVLPVGLTIYVVWALIGYIDAWVLPLIPDAYEPDALIHHYVGPDTDFPVRGVGVLVFLFFTTLIGWAARGLIGRSVIRRTESLVDRMPVVRSVYSGIKQIAETFFAKNEKSFDRACLVEFPRPGCWAVGMIAASAKGEIAGKLPQAEQMIAVFVALTPLTSGMLLYVPARDVVMLDMKPDDAVKLILSAGLVYPAPKEAVAATLGSKPLSRDGTQEKNLQ